MNYRTGIATATNPLTGPAITIATTTHLTLLPTGIAIATSHPTGIVTATSHPTGIAIAINLRTGIATATSHRIGAATTPPNQPTVATFTTRPTAKPTCNLIPPKFSTSTKIRERLQVNTCMCLQQTRGETVGHC